MHDGKNQLIEFVNQHHPNEEILIDDLAPGRPRSLPGGFVVTDNPMNFSILNPDPTRISLFGPKNDMGIALRVHEGPRGLFVRGLDLVVAIARLVEVGPPVWSRRPGELSDWWKAQIATCAPFTVLDAAPRDRAENENHIQGCQICGPVAEAMAASISAGSSAYKDTDVADMIERAHADQAGAVRHYEAKRLALVGTPTVSAKRRKAAEVPA